MFGPVGPPPRREPYSVVPTIAVSINLDDPELSTVRITGTYNSRSLSQLEKQLPIIRQLLAGDAPIDPPPA